MDNCPICGCEARVGRAEELEGKGRVRFDITCPNRKCANYGQVFAQEEIEI